MTGLLPVFASLCVYCLWTEMKRGSVARLGTPGEMLTGTESCQMHTPKGAIKTDLQLHTLLPPTLLHRVINFNRNIFLVFFPHFVIFLCACRGKSFTLCPSAGTFQSFIICSVYLSFLSLPLPTFSPLQYPFIFSSYLSPLTSATLLPSNPFSAPLMPFS